eukprot:scaffold4766_cov115-Isochrysis_galbana.AAC.8
MGCSRDSRTIFRPAAGWNTWGVMLSWARQDSLRGVGFDDRVEPRSSERTVRHIGVSVHRVDSLKQRGGWRLQVVSDGRCTLEHPHRQIPLPHQLKEVPSSAQQDVEHGHTHGEVLNHASLNEQFHHGRDGLIMPRVVSNMAVSMSHARGSAREFGLDTKVLTGGQSMVLSGSSCRDSGVSGAGTACARPGRA